MACMEYEPGVWYLTSSSGGHNFKVTLKGGAYEVAYMNGGWTSGEAVACGVVGSFTEAVAHVDYCGEVLNKGLRRGRDHDSDMSFVKWVNARCE